MRRNALSTNREAVELEDRVHHQIERAKSLPVGWDGYSAEPPSQAAIDGALVALDILYRLDSLPVRAVPLADGGMALAIMVRPFYAALELYNDGEAVVAFSDRKERQLAWEVKVNEAQLRLFFVRAHSFCHGDRIARD